MRVPCTQLVAPVWIMGVGLVAVIAPPTGAMSGVLLLLACVVVVPVVITGLLWTPHARPSTLLVWLHSIRLAR